MRLNGGSQGARSTGITLLELLVVLFILGVLTATVVPVFSRYGPLARNDMQHAARELYAFLRAAKIYAATYRTDTALAYAVVLKEDSYTGQTVESINAAAMVYKMPEYVRQHCYFFADLDGEPLVRPVPIPDDEYAFIPVRGQPVEQEKGMFRPMPGLTGILCENLLPNGAGCRSRLNETLKQIRVYEVAFVDNYPVTGVRYQARLITPAVLNPNEPGILSGLPDRLQYLLAYPAGRQFLQYKPDPIDPSNQDNLQDFRVPAHIFTPSGRMDMDDVGAERFRIYVSYAPDAAPAERFVDVNNPAAITDPQNPDVFMQDARRMIPLDLYRGTGRVAIADGWDMW